MSDNVSIANLGTHPAPLFFTVQPMSLIIGYILAIAVGISLGLIGGGGSILAVPILRYVIGLDPKEAIAMSLAVVGIVSLIGVIPHWAQGNVNLRTAAIFTPAAMVGAYLGARIAGLPFITDTFQLVSFGIVMVLASVLMIRKGSHKVTQPSLETGDGPLPEAIAASEDLSAQDSHQKQWWLIPLEGLGVGILTGFVGVGGGFMIIPALVLLGGIPMKEAIGTSLLIIAFKSASGFAGYLNQVTIDWNVMITFTLAASLGTVFGAYMTRFIDGKQLQKGFGYFVLAVAIFVLIKR
jgi:hypothetical protein